MSESSLSIQIAAPASQLELWEQFVKKALNDAQVEAERFAQLATEKQDERERLEARRRAFFAKAPKAYALYVAQRKSFPSAQCTYRHIACLMGLDIPLSAEVLVQHQKRAIRRKEAKYVLRCAEDGLSNRQIALNLGVSVRTVSRRLNAARSQKMAK